MAKLKKPLLSLGASGGLGKAISFVKRGGRSIAEKKPEIPDAKTLAQLTWRHMYQKAVALWHALSPAEKQEWESLARAKHMTGFAWFISQALKPNPGLYLPLQGGKMAGDIDMDGYKIVDLPDPIFLQEPVTRKYFEDNLPVGGYTEGCRVDRGSPQSIPHATSTYVIFDTEDYDTDEMHDLVVNPDRVTIKTAGIYLIVVHFYFIGSSVGYRRCYIYKNASTICQDRQPGNAVTWTSFNISTIHQFTIGQYIRVKVYQNSGAPLSLQRASHYTPYLMVQRIG